MTLSGLIKGCCISGTSGNPDTDITGVCDNSKDVEKGHLFIAVRGNKSDGHSYIEEAVKRGAAALLVEDPFIAAKYSSNNDLTVVLADDTRKILGTAASRFYRDPSGELKVIGITGTNGKTTTAYILESVISAGSGKPGIIGTVNYRYGGNILKADTTTPGAIKLQGLMYDMVKAGSTHCVMEVSSHALDQSRVEGTTFDVAIFTNLTQDHLDYHADMDAYGRAKELLFLEVPSLSKKAVINTDDPFGAKLAKKTENVISYGIKNGDIHLEDFRQGSEGMELSISSPSGKFVIRTALVGEHNIYNIMAAIGGGISAGVDTASICRGIESLEKIPGRLERVSIDMAKKKCRVFVDYAHTPDALKRAIMALRPTTEGRLITLFGCGGDRDRTKRPLMGKVSAIGSDYTIITSDNPRSEDPSTIIEDIEKGVIEGGAQKNSSYTLIVDRREALRYAASMASDEDTVLVAGKGHEDYQIIGRDTLRFDDREETMSAFMEIA